MDRAQIIDAIHAQEPQLRILRVKSLGLFGSAARGEAGPQSDVDLLVEFDGPPSFDSYMDLKYLLEGVLGCPVDLVTQAALKSSVRAYVERDLIRVA